jgi:hypothetical protein
MSAIDHKHTVTVVFKNDMDRTYAPEAFEVFEWKAYKFAGVDMLSIRTVDADDRTARIEHFPMTSIETVIETSRP